MTNTEQLEGKPVLSKLDLLKQEAAEITDGLRDQLKQKFPALAEDIFDANGDVSTSVKVDKDNGDIILIVGDKRMNVVGEEAADLANMLVLLQKEQQAHEQEISTLISTIRTELDYTQRGLLTQLSVDGGVSSGDESSDANKNKFKKEKNVAKKDPVVVQNNSATQEIVDGSTVDNTKDTAAGKFDTVNNEAITDKKDGIVTVMTEEEVKAQAALESQNTSGDTKIPYRIDGQSNNEIKPTETADADEQPEAASDKRNQTEYQAFEAEGLDKLPKRARQAFRQAVENNTLHMGDEISTGVIYPDAKEGSDVNFRDLFGMVKSINIANAFTILKQGMDQKGAGLLEFASIDKGQFVLKSPDAVEKFWEKQAKGKDKAYNAVGSFGAHEKNMLRKFTETFFKITNKAGNTTDNEKLFMAALGITLTGDSLNKFDISRNLLGTQKLAIELAAKLKDPDMKMDNAIATVLGNYNFDKKVDEKDTHTVTGQQMASMYNDAKYQLCLKSNEPTDRLCIKEEAETAMVQNMVDMLIYHIDTKDNGSGKVDWKTMNIKGRDAALTELKGFKTEKELLKKITEVPSLVIAYQDIFRMAGENASILFLKGKKGYEEVIERKADTDAPVKKETPDLSWDRPFEQLSIDPTIVSPEVASLSPELKNRVEKHVSEAYDRAVQDLYKKVQEGKYADGTEIPENLRPQVEEAAKDLLDASVQGPNKKLLTINALGALVNLVKGEEGLGLAANVTSEKLNDLISNPEKGWYNSVNLTPGVYAAPNGQPIIGMALGLQGKKMWTNKGGDHTFMYGAAVGAGISKGKLVAGPAVNLGYEEQVNGRAVAKTIDKTKANYVGAVLAASLTEVGVGLYFRQDQYRAIEQQQKSIEDGLKGILQNAVKSAETLDAKGLTVALQKQYPKSSPDNISKMAQNLSAVIKPYLLNSGDKATLQEHLKGLGQGDKTVDGVISQVMEDVAKLYALDWRNDQVMNNMKKVQLTDFGIGKSLSLDAADPVGAFVKNILPIYAGVGVTIYGKARYQELAWSKAHAHDQLRNARGVDIDDRVSAKWSEKVPHLNVIFQDIAGENVAKKDASVDATTDKVDTQKPMTEYFTVAGENVLIDPAVLKLPGMNVSVLHTLKPYINYENGKLVVPNTIPVMFHTLSEGKTKSYDLIIGTVGLENATSIKSFDTLTGGHPEKIGDLGTVTSVEGLIGTINNAKNDPDLKEIHNIAAFTTVEKLGAAKDAAYTNQIGNILVNAKSGVTLTGAKSVTINNITYYVIENPKHAQISFDKVAGKKDTYTMNVVNNETLPMSLQYKGFKESTVVAELAKDMAEKVPQSIKDFVAGPQINTMLLKGEVHKTGGLKDKTVLAIQKATISDSVVDWQAAAAAANKIAGKDLFVLDTLNPDALKDSLRYLNAKMALTPAARDRDAKRYELYKADASSDIIRSDNPETQKLLDELYANGKLDPAKNVQLQKLLGGDKNILHSVAGILKARDGNMNTRLAKEGYNPTATKAFRDAWEKSINSLGGKDTQVYAGSEMKGAIGMVFGYNADNTYDEKFVVQPRLATKPGSNNAMPDSYAPIDNVQMRAHFLNNLAQEEGGLLDRILKPLVEDACGKDCYDANRAVAVQQFVQGMKEDGSATIKVLGKEFTIKADFGHAFYNECFNETIVMNNIQVETSPKPIISDTTLENKGGLYINAFNTVGEMVRNQKKISVGILAGERKQKEEEYTSGTETGEVDGSGTDTGEVVVIPGGEAGDIPGSGSTGTGGTPDIPVGEPTPTFQTTDVLHASVVYPQIVGAINHNGLASNISKKDTTDKKKEEEKVKGDDTSKKDIKTTEK